MNPFSVRAPVTMPIQASSSSSRRSTAASMPSATSRLTAFRASGRLIVMTAMCPSSS
jgi:hypothetical protein